MNCSLGLAIFVGVVVAAAGTSMEFYIYPNDEGEYECGRYYIKMRQNS